MNRNCWTRVVPPVVVRMTAVLVTLLSFGASAHDIPADVRVVAYVKPAAETLQFLVRVPLSAMREVDFPKRGPGYLDLARVDTALANAANLWLAGNIDIYQDDTRLAPPKVVAARVSLAADRSFTTFDSAMAHLKGSRIPETEDLYWNQQLLDVLLEYPARPGVADFAVHPKLDRLAQRVTMVMRFLPPGGVERAFELHGDPGLVRLDPRWHQAALRFVQSGFFHILEGIDHLLFLACLVIPYRRFVPLAVIVTSFTVAHSVTLAASALGYAPGALWFPPLVEALIALSIVYMAVENMLGATRVERRWVLAFGFGLVHGFGFSFALRESLQFAGSHLVTSLAAFNIGVECGQLLVVAVLAPVLNRVLRNAAAERMGIILLSAFVAHTGWHWLLERGEQLMKFPLPVIDAAAAASLLRWLMGALIVGGLVWVVRHRVRRWLE